MTVTPSCPTLSVVDRLLRRGLQLWGRFAGYRLRRESSLDPEAMGRHRAMKHTFRMQNQGAIIDISPTISVRTAVFPGDQRYSRSETLAMHSGDQFSLSWISTTLHIGAHADAPGHYDKAGVAIDQRDLNYYIGPCQVIDVRHGAGPRVVQADLEGVEITAPRVLLRTDSHVNDEIWHDDFRALAPELIEHLHREGVFTVYELVALPLRLEGADASPVRAILRGS